LDLFQPGIKTLALPLVNHPDEGLHQMIGRLQRLACLAAGGEFLAFALLKVSEQRRGPSSSAHRTGLLISSKDRFTTGPAA
jgi:hypothetical protein